MSLIALSIPVFFLLIGLEILISKVYNKSNYRFGDSIANLGCGIGQQVIGVFFKLFIIVSYYLIYYNFRITTISLNWWTTLLLFLGVDFCYYWFHRLSHEVNFLWAAHIVHHQSEDYNLTVALRQSWFQGLFSWVFYIPLAFVGFSVESILIVGAINTLYQFWIHTREIKSMGFLEYIINTPSHHRVHHGSDPKYLDRNHAGSLIIWDKMFGTFQKEETEPVYGITSPLNSFNPWKANFHYWQELISIAKKSDSIKDKILIFLKPPGWLPASMGGFQKPKEIDYENCQKYDVKLDHTMNVYIFIHFTFILLTSSYFLFFSNSMFNQPSTYTLVGFLSLSVFILFSLYVLGKGLESHSSFKNLEILRLLLLFPIGLAFVQISSLILVATISLSIFALSSLLLYFYVKSDTPVIV